MYISNKWLKKMINIVNLEMHVTHNCNLTCEACDHYSNYKTNKWMISPEQANDWMGFWKNKINPQTFSILGGEPTLNPDLPEIIKITRNNWPQSKIRVVTNGFYLFKHPLLPVVLENDSNATLYLSLHHDSYSYRNKTKPILDLLIKWVKKYSINVEVYHSTKTWKKKYIGLGEKMKPFGDNKPRLSWERCGSNKCPQLFDGKIWKCGPLAYLHIVDEQYKLTKDWEHYLSYKPLEINSSNDQISNFFNLEEETYCNMCPSNPPLHDIPIPIAGVNYEDETNQITEYFSKIQQKLQLRKIRFYQK